MNTKHRTITFSIVSHGQSSLIAPLLEDFSKLRFDNFTIIITINIPEDESAYRGHNFPISIIRNETPKGFGANHNAAFEKSTSDLFAILNPDIRLILLDFEYIFPPFFASNIGAMAPLVVNLNEEVEDSARFYPTFFRLFKRVICKKRSLDYIDFSKLVKVEWAAGMFIIFNKYAFEEVNGFDDRRFFMYFEDADICRRINNNGWDVILNPSIKVMHEAQRASHKNLKHFYWHMVSAFRFLTKI